MYSNWTITLCSCMSSRNAFAAQNYRTYAKCRGALCPEGLHMGENESIPLGIDSQFSSLLAFLFAKIHTESVFAQFAFLQNAELSGPKTLTRSSPTNSPSNFPTLQVPLSRCRSVPVHWCARRRHRFDPRHRRHLSYTVQHLRFETKEILNSLSLGMS